ncbi:metalloregulator ArsR/SmtB family transcription factor [Puniceicoccaceae bacterium K14]|nr:metalloregulator ArsR/SmtB family transcription factor [Puniceicoccaceae bacterium K14]
MVNLSEEQTNRIFHALSDSTRRSMLERIAQADVSVAELKEPFPVSGPAISKHLKVLEQAGLITRRVDGKQRRFAMNTEPLKNAQLVINQLTSFWMKRLANLDEFLKNDIADPKKK